MNATLDEKDGWLFVKEVSIDSFQPQQLILWWPTGVRWYQFAQYFADEERARAMIGAKLIQLSHVTYQLDGGLSGGLKFTMRDGGQTKPEHSEVIPIDPPKQRGRPLPVKWRDGRWWKETQRGWRVM
jgi:hypothetical protein